MTSDSSASGGSWLPVGPSLVGDGWLARLRDGTLRWPSPSTPSPPTPSRSTGDVPDRGDAGTDARFRAGGTREGVPATVAPGETLRVEVTVESATRPATVTDEIPPGWAVEPLDAVEVDRTEDAVVLGGVAPADLDDGPVTFGYLATAPTASGATDAAFGPARALTTVRGRWASASLAGTDVTTVVRDTATRSSPVSSR